MEQMHRLTRPYPEPEALSQAREKGVSRWDDLSPEDRAQVREALLQMQNNRCAYCESTISDVLENNQRGNIEHLLRKASAFFPELMFEWNNLFYSCPNEDTCGHNKDKTVKNKGQNMLLIHPCNDNPEDFFVFESNGRIAVKSNLNEFQRKRAEFTIEAFNLNDSELVEARKNTQLQYVGWLENSQIPEDHLQELVTCCLQELPSDVPFITAIRHFVRDIEREDIS